MKRIDVPIEGGIPKYIQFPSTSFVVIVIALMCCVV